MSEEDEERVRKIIREELVAILPSLFARGGFVRQGDRSYNVGERPSEQYRMRR